MKKNLVLFCITQVFSAGVPVGAYFWGAGLIDPTLMLFGGLLVLSVLFQVVLFLRRPALFAERLGAQPDAQPWDRTLMLASSFLLLAAYGWGGWLHRLGWAPVPGDWVWVGFFGYLAALLLGSWAMLSNPFYSTLVRIQTERGHEVVQRGPYQWVRHPGYLAILVQYLTVPLVLGSFWVYPVTVVLVALLVVRTSKEDALLGRELNGYAEFQGRVRTKLVPLVF